MCYNYSVFRHQKLSTEGSVMPLQGAMVGTMRYASDTEK